MNFAEIIIRALIPFGNTTALVLCGLIALFAISALWNFNKRIHHVLQQLHEANDVLNQYNAQTISEHFEDVNKKFSDDGSIMRTGWPEYDKTLLKSRDGDKEGQVLVCSTVDASMYFNETTLLSNINLDSFLSVPGYLTGFGIFGTFFGLTMGLSGIDLRASDVSVLKSGIAGLLSSLGTAFSTSLWGLIGATGFSMSSRSQIHKVREEISHLQNNINRKFVCKTPEHFLSDISQTMEKQLVQLSKFNEEVAYVVGDTIGEALDKNLQPTLSELLEAIKELNKSGTATIAESLNDSVGVQLGGFAEILREVGNNMRENSRSTEDMIGKMNEQFVSATENVTRMLEDASQKQNYATDKMMASTQQMMSSIRDSITEMQKSMFDNSASIGTELSKGISETLTSLRGHIAALTSNFEATQNASVTGLTETVEAIKTSLVQLTEKFEESHASQRHDIESLTNDLTEKLQRISNNFAGMHENSTRQIENSLVEIEEFSNTIKDVSKQASNLAEKLSSAAIPLSESASVLERSVAGFKQSQESIMSQCKEIMFALQENQAAYHQNISTLNELFVEIKNTVSYYDSSLKGTNVELDAVFKTLSDRVREYDTMVGENLNKYMQAFDDKLSQGIGHLDTGIDDLSDAIDEFGNIVNKLKSR